MPHFPPDTVPMSKLPLETIMELSTAMLNTELTRSEISVGGSALGAMVVHYGPSQPCTAMRRISQNFA